MPIHSLFDLTGQVAIVTGGAGMLGLEYAQTLAEAGANVALLDIKKVIDRIVPTSFGDRQIRSYEVDLTKRDAVFTAISQVVSDLGVPTILINNAGIGTIPNTHSSVDGLFEDYSEDVWDKMIDSHLKSALFTSQAFIREIRKVKKAGSIINISSTYGVVSPEQGMYEFRRKKGDLYYKPVGYTVAKSGMIGFTRWLAEYSAQYQVRVNALVPGGVDTSDLDPEFRKLYETRTMLGRMAKSSDYNGAILFLASSASNYMTGSIVTVDGGWTAR